MREKSVAVERDPFACEVTRFVGKPVEFGAAVIEWLSRFPTQRTIPIFHGHMNSLVLCRRKGFQRAQYTLVVNGLKMYCHGTCIVSGAVIAAAQPRASHDHVVGVSTARTPS
jgi:hypothetical protein